MIQSIDFQVVFSKDLGLSRKGCLKIAIVEPGKVKGWIEDKYRKVLTSRFLS